MTAIKIESEVGPHTGAILAGGKSLRMGRPKHAMRLRDGRMMIQAVADVMGRVSPRIVVVGDIEALPDCGNIRDLRPACGPLGGIEALLASGIDSHYLVCPCDVPLITVDILRALAVETPEPVRALRFSDESAPRPLPLAISDEMLPAVQRELQDNQFALHHFLAKIDVRCINAPSAWRRYLENVNTPADFERI